MENKTLGEGSWSTSMNNLRRKAMGENWEAPASDSWDMGECRTRLGEQYTELVSETSRGCMTATEQLLTGGSRVRACPDDVSDGFKAFKYALWFHDDSRPSALYHLPEAGNIRILAKFRCGAHRLDAESCRINADRTERPRSARVCIFCDSGVVEDELHVLVCRAWQGYRDLFPSFFEGEDFRSLLDAMELERDVDFCMKRVVNPKKPELTDMLAGYLKKFFWSETKESELFYLCLLVSYLVLCCFLFCCSVCIWLVKGFEGLCLLSPVPYIWVFASVSGL